eukprot:13640245-Alexandrium_andersonii.AAC.1
MLQAVHPQPGIPSHQAPANMLCNQLEYRGGALDALDALAGHGVPGCCQLCVTVCQGIAPLIGERDLT